MLYYIMLYYIILHYIIACYNIQCYMIYYVITLLKHLGPWPRAILRWPYGGTTGNAAEISKGFCAHQRTEHASGAGDLFPPENPAIETGNFLHSIYTPSNHLTIDFTGVFPKWRSAWFSGLGDLKDSEWPEIQPSKLETSWIARGPLTTAFTPSGESIHIGRRFTPSGKSSHPDWNPPA
jgi:hypothetical protein